MEFKPAEEERIRYGGAQAVNDDEEEEYEEGEDDEDVRI